MIRNEIKKIIQKAAKIKDEIKVEYPVNSAMGDYATNIAFALAKKENKGPQEIARMLAEKILSDKNAKKMFEN